MLVTVRGGNWKRLQPIAEELLSNPDLSKIELEEYDEDLDLYVLHYKGLYIEVDRVLRIADGPGLKFKDLLVVEDRRIRKLKRKLRGLLGGE